MYRVHIPYNEKSISSSMYAKYIANELKSKLPTLEFIAEGLSKPIDLGDNDILLVIVDGLQIDIICFYEVLNALLLKKTVIVHSKDETLQLASKYHFEWINDLLKALKEIN